mgnify:CR=1 FL=1
MITIRYTVRHASAAALKHVLTEVLDKDKTTNPEYYSWIAYENINGMTDIMSIPIEQMETRTYEHKGKLVTPNLNMMGNVRILQAYYRFYCTTNGQPCMSNDDWMALTYDEYNLFCWTKLMFAHVKAHGNHYGLLEQV